MTASSRRNLIAPFALLASLPLAGAASAADDLLGSARGGTAMWKYCAGKPNRAPVPPDPRSLVGPQTNAGKAVHYNIRWRNCHFDPEAVGERAPAETCGELRARYQAGHVLMDPGSTGPGGLFTGADPDEYNRLTTFTADQYNALWTAWGGYATRPDDFDELVAERYGSVFSGSPNPYPLPGEDPNQANGGSGTLPEMFTQMREGSGGEWSGEITLTCHMCHSGAVGAPGGTGPGVVWGSSSSLLDLDLVLRDLLQVGYETSPAGALIHLNRTRGRSNAALFELPWASIGQHGMDNVADLVASGSAGDMEAPAWWNMGRRASKFVDGVFPMDTPRWDTIFFAPYVGLQPSGEAWMQAHSPDVNVWVESLEAPTYPYPIDTALAEEGAVIFHEKDLWKNGANPQIPRPEGNGSCAGCHGAYAPRYVVDPAYLDTPALEGVAGYTVPIEIIGTDTARLDSHANLQEAARGGFFSYPSTEGTPQDCGPQNHPDLNDGRAPGYLAPPLYGIWATAPYLHNGSVPNLWQVLKPSERPQIWRRWSKPPLPPAGPPNQLGVVIMGYDTDLDRAYDPVKVGWRYDPIPCQVESPLNPSVSPYLACDTDPSAPQDPLAQQVAAGLYANVQFGWNLTSIPVHTPAQIEERKIYNTRMFSQGNEGHEFTAVLSDSQREALIEYLKTL